MVKTGAEILVIMAPGSFLVPLHLGGRVCPPIDLAEWLYPLTHSSLDVVLGHFPVLVSQQFLRVRQVAGVGCCLGSDIPKLKIHLRRRPRLVKA